MAALKIIGAKMSGGTTIEIIACTGTRIAIGMKAAGTSMTGGIMAIAKKNLDIPDCLIYIGCQWRNRQACFVW
jgi:hypothetical protein